jgi:hypothetical protein
MNISTPIYIAMHNAYKRHNDFFYCLTIHPDWRYVMSRVEKSCYKKPRIVIRGVSDDDAPRGVIVYDNFYCNVATPLARDKAVFIELEPIRDASVSHPEGDSALFSRAYTGEKYTMFDDDNVYYCCVSPGCGCVSCVQKYHTGIVCVGRCDCPSAMHSVDAAYIFDMWMLRLYHKIIKSKEHCACWLLRQAVYCSHLRLSEYCDNALECSLRCSERYGVIRCVPMVPLVRINWDGMLEKLTQYVEGQK